MKKFFKGLLLTLVVLIILPIALLFIFVFDTGKMSVEYDNNFSTEDWSKALVVDSLDNTKTNKMMQFKVTESDINNFINASIKDNELLNKYLKRRILLLATIIDTLNLRR